jgi:hypothetical protein
MWELEPTPGNVHSESRSTEPPEGHHDESSPEAEQLMLRREPVSTWRLMTILAWYISTILIVGVTSSKTMPH